MDIKRLMDIGCYRGMRHRRNLPVARPADAHECADAEGSPQADDRGQEEGDEEVRNWFSVESCLRFDSELKAEG